MKYIALLFLATLSVLGHSSEVKVMTFNVMCDVCGDRDVYDRFKDRLGQIADTIKRHDPDLISLQEFRTKRQLMRLNDLLGKKYRVLYSNGVILNYADPALFIKRERFDVLSHHSFWLGPRNGRFSFGWQFAIPRKLRYSRVKDRTTGKLFIFAGSHFDNHIENKAPSAELVNDYFSKFELPVVLAADTNLKPELPAYEVLKGNLFNDSYDQVSDVSYSANTTYSVHDACNIKKAKTFPECRVDHIFLSHKSPYHVKDWIVDVHRYGKKERFASDHRAVMVVLDTLD